MLSISTIGLVFLVGIFLLILILDSLRKKKYYLFLHKNHKTEYEKSTRQQEARQNVQDKEQEITSIWDLTGTQNEEDESPIYETIKSNQERTGLLTNKEEQYYTQQEIKDLQGTVKNLQREIQIQYPIM